jgi:superfamily II DNA or RNA helicase
MRESEFVIDEAPRASAPIAGEEVARFVRPRIRVWNEALCVDRGEALRGDLVETRAPVIALSFEYQGFVVRAADPSERVFCGGAGAMVPQRRDRDAEQAARIQLESFGAVELELLERWAAAPGCEADYAVQPDGDAQVQCAFVAHALPQLRALGWDVRVDDAYPYRVLHEPPWYSSLAADEDKPDWFNLELGIEVGGHRVDLLPVLLARIDEVSKGQDLLRLGQRGPCYVQVPDRGCYVELPAEQYRTLVRVLYELYQGDPSGPAFPASRVPAVVGLEESLVQGGIALHTYGGFEPRARGRSLSAAPDAIAAADEAVISSELRAELRPYQAQGVAWLQKLRAHGAGGVLADDMGLGKTLQTIAHLCTERDAGTEGCPSLVIAPTSLVANWRRELERFAPHLRVCVLFGPGRQARRAELGRADVALTSYSVLLRDAEWLSTRDFHCLVLDEAQAIKNPRSRASQLVKSLNAAQRICLSGTPVENNLHELWSIFDFAMPGLLGSEEQFRHFYRVPIEQHRDAEKLHALRDQVSPYLLRRMKEHVARELPPKTEVVRPVELHGKQRALYESIRVAAHDKVRSALRKRGVAGSTITILAALTRLRQLCCDPRLVHGEAAREVRESAKYDLLMSLLQEQLAQGRRALVFSQFASMLGLISRGLRERGIAHAVLTGATADRERPVRAFESREVDVFLISLKAGGTGLNLVSADTVIHYDPWWNPAAQAQATDRAYRIGQQKPVFVYNLIAAGSVEERMLGLQQYKRRLAGAVVASGQGQGGSSPSLLGEAEVEHLLAPLDDD